MKSRLVAALLGLMAASSGFAQGEVSDGFFTLINTAPKSTGFKCYIANSKETNVLTPVGGGPDDNVGNGYSTGLIRWSPANGELVAEAPHRQPARIKPFIKSGEAPVIIVKDKGGGSLSFSLLPKPSDRNGAFYDAVNLTSKFELGVVIDGKQVQLPRGQRVRVSRKKNLKFEIPGGPKDVLESLDDPSHVMIFFDDDAGKIRYMVVADYAS